MERLPNWKTFVFELLIYAVLIVAYFWLVLHYLGGWFKEIYDHNRLLYATMALVVMVGQAVGLEIISALIVWLVRRAGLGERRK
jgi:hypothetical protein